MFKKVNTGVSGAYLGEQIIAI